VLLVWVKLILPYQMTSLLSTGIQLGWLLPTKIKLLFLIPTGLLILCMNLPLAHLLMVFPLSQLMALFYIWIIWISPTKKLSVPLVKHLLIVVWLSVWIMLNSLLISSLLEWVLNISAKTCMSSLSIATLLMWALYTTQVGEMLK